MPRAGQLWHLANLHEHLSWASWKGLWTSITMRRGQAQICVWRPEVRQKRRDRLQKLKAFQENGGKASNLDSKWKEDYSEAPEWETPSKKRKSHGLCLSKILPLIIINEKTKRVLRKGRGGEGVPKKILYQGLRVSQSGFWVLQLNTVKPEYLGRIYPQKYIYNIPQVKPWQSLFTNVPNVFSGTRMTSDPKTSAPWITGLLPT